MGASDRPGHRGQGPELLAVPLPKVRHAVAHRWRFARVRNPLGERCLYAPELGVAYAGDGCLGPRVESAWLSGVAAAGRLLGEAAAPRG